MLGHKIYSYKHFQQLFKKKMRYGSLVRQEGVSQLAVIVVFADITVAEAAVGELRPDVMITTSETVEFRPISFQLNTNICTTLVTY